MTNEMNTVPALTPTQMLMMRELDGRLCSVSYPANRIRTVEALLNKGLVSFYRTENNRIAVSLTMAGSDMAYYGHLDS